MRILLIGASTLLLATLSAQNSPSGFLETLGISAASRGQLSPATGQLLCRFDFDDYRGIGAGPTGVSEFTGLRAIVQDQDASTPEVVSLHVYGEQAGVPDFPSQPAAAPAGTTALASIANIALFGGGPAGPAAIILSVTFATPLALPTGQDVFLGLELPAAPSWPSDGTSLQTEATAAPPPGPAPIPFGSYVLTHDPARALLAYGATPVQGAIEPLVDASRGRGVAVAIVHVGPVTVQTSSFLTGLHPDAAAPPLHTGRADDLGYVVFGAGFFDIVGWYGDVAGTFRASPLLMASLVPGGQGLYCLTSASVPLGLQFGSGTGTDLFQVPLLPTHRLVLRGLDLTEQAIVARLGGSVSGTPCARQRL